MMLTLKALLFSYWLVCTICGTYWLVKNPSARRYEDEEYVSLLEVIAKFALSSLLAWFFFPMGLLAQIKFKR